MSYIPETFPRHEVGTMVACAEGIGKVAKVEMIPTEFGTKDPLHTIQLNGGNGVYRTVNDLQATKCSDEHRWDPYMKWCVECTAEELGENVYTAVPRVGCSRRMREA